MMVINSSEVVVREAMESELRLRQQKGSRQRGGSAPESGGAVVVVSPQIGGDHH